MNKNTLIEVLFLTLYISIMLWIGLGDTWGHKIQHDFPNSYLASDPFQHQTRAQWIKDVGNYRFEAPYYSAGYDDVVGAYPPILNHLAVLLSHTSGLQVYDTLLFLTVIFALTTSLIFYFIIRHWSIHIALLSLPLTTFLFTLRQTRIAFFWGHWPALLGVFFFVATCWMLMHLSKKHSWFFLSILLSGTALGHTAATVFAILFISFFFVASLFTKKLTKQQIVNLLLGFLVFFIISLDFLILFKYTWYISNAMVLFSLELSWDAGGGYLHLKDFGIPVLTVMTFGGLAILFSKNSGNFFPKILSIFALLGGLANYIGFGIRAFNFRFYWPITLSFFFGVGVYKIITPFTKKYPFLVTYLTSAALMTAFLFFYYQPTGQIDGLMNKHTWETLLWIRDNTPPNAKPFFFYGDSYDQDGSLGNTHRRSTRVEITHLLETLQKRTLQRQYPTKELYEVGALFPKKTGRFNYTLRLKRGTDYYDRAIRDLCSFDYYIFDTFGRFPPLVQLNHKIATTFLNNNFTLVFQNPLNVILKNQNPGGTCFGPTNNITF